MGTPPSCTSGVGLIEFFEKSEEILEEENKTIRHKNVT